MKAYNVCLNETEDKVRILNQAILPEKTEYLELDTREDLYDAIFTLKVRGAPAIGIFAAYAIYVLSAQYDIDNYDDFEKKFMEDKEYLNSSRPTAVNLSKQLNRMEDCLKANKSDDIKAVLEILKKEALLIQQEDIDMCRAISEYGLSLMKEGDTVLTHCNAGEIATSLYGTGLGPLLLGAEKGFKLNAYVDETRPLLQGARLTMYELMRAGVDCTLICDNMASIVMREGKIQACFVGCDRVAANGDTANKIGTSGVAILAKHYGIPVYVFCPSSTVDFSCKTGKDIKIELRNPDEITKGFYAGQVVPEGAKAYNPAFDVTDAELISAIVTEKGIARYPYTESLKELLG